jgi:hypothetical protein
MPTTQTVLAIASLHELHGDSWPSSSTGISFCCNQQYSVTAVTTSEGAVAERYAYSAYGQPTILDASMDGKNGPPGFWGDNAIATGSRSAEFDWNCCGCKKEKDRSNTVK